MSDLAIPAYAGSAGPGDFVELVSGMSAGNELDRGDFVTVDASAGDVNIAVGDENDLTIYGICEKDERNGKVLVFTGKDLGVPLVASAATPKAGGIIYLASPTEVSGTTEATQAQIALGTLIEMIGNKCIVATHWYRDRTPIDKA